MKTTIDAEEEKRTLTMEMIEDAIKHPEKYKEETTIEMLPLQLARMRRSCLGNNNISNRDKFLLEEERLRRGKKCTQ